ncbi:MAG: hypothetical protein JSW14_04100 [Candidatus Bathyarchaeum sp.]|nr:MAG: hypothetical protein JSW14_04100 [Candidatus Bathyarchaeum sp.]
MGLYKNFPETVHGIALFNYQGSAKSIQQAILCALHHLNHEIHDLGAVTPYLKQKCKVSFEFGVAEGSVFNFLDDKELDQCLRRVAEKELQTFDFFFVVRYHATSKGGKRVPLRFDYHVLRYIFQEGCLEMRIRHERGTQRIPLDDLTDFIAKRINAELSRRTLNPLVLGYFKKVRLQ